MLLLYGMLLEQVFELDRSCIDTSDAGLKIRLGDDWVKVEKPVASLFSEIVAQASDEVGFRLFPERLNGDCLSVGTVQHYLQGITSN